MKKNLSLFPILFALFLLESSAARAQRVPAWVPEKGYWVVESQLQQPLRYTVRFYSDSGQLLYTEKLEGFEVNIRQRKVKMRLRKALDAVVAAWENHQSLPATANLLALQFKNEGQ